MKTLHQSKYSYLGIAKVGDSLYHAFQSRFTDMDPEIIFVPRARMITKTKATSLFFDPIVRNDAKGRLETKYVFTVFGDDDDVEVYTKQFTVRKEQLGSEGAYSLMKVDGGIFGYLSNVVVS